MRDPSIDSSAESASGATSDRITTSSRWLNNESLESEHGWPQRLSSAHWYYLSHWESHLCWCWGPMLKRSRAGAPIS